MVLPFLYIAGVGAGFFASYLAVVQQIGEVSSGGFFLIFWMFQNPPDLLYSVLKGMTMATVIVLVGCYYGYNASRRTGGSRDGDGEVDGVEHRAGAPDRDARDPAVLGRESQSANRRMSMDERDDEPQRTRRGADARGGPAPRRGGAPGRARHRRRPARRSLRGRRRGHARARPRRRRPRHQGARHAPGRRRPRRRVPVAHRRAARVGRPRTPSSSSRSTRPSAATRSCAA